MAITGAIVVYAVSFFVCLLIILPRGVPTQEEAGEIEPGTPPGAPAEFRIWRKFLYAALAAIPPTIIGLGFMEFGWLSLSDFDFLYPESFHRTLQ